MRNIIRCTAGLLALSGWLITHHAVPAAAQAPSPTRFTLMPTPVWMAAMDMSTPMPGMGTTSPAPPGPREGPAYAAEGTPTLPNLADRASWPSPVADTATYSFLLFDLLEYQRTKDGLDALRWDILGWLGGDYNRFWFKSEGRFVPREESEVEVQALYGRLIAPFFVVQAGLRVDPRLGSGSNPTRVYAVIGLQGLAPYRFDIEPTLFISHKGQVSARLTATYEVLLSQRLVLQPRLETNVALQKDEAISVGAGVNDFEVGLRLRYEIRREVAPYIGVTWKENFGETHDLVTREGIHPAHLAFVAGLRMWF